MSDKPVHISALGKRLLERLRKSAKVLAEPVRFVCDKCKDTGWVLIGKRYSKCDECELATERPEQKERFF